jgi:hypothetical protein
MPQGNGPKMEIHKLQGVAQRLLSALSFHLAPFDFGASTVRTPDIHCQYSVSIQGLAGQSCRGRLPETETMIACQRAGGHLSESTGRIASACHDWGAQLSAFGRLPKVRHSPTTCQTGSAPCFQRRVSSSSTLRKYGTAWRQKKGATVNIPKVTCRNPRDRLSEFRTSRVKEGRPPVANVEIASRRSGRKLPDFQLNRGANCQDFGRFRDIYCQKKASATRRNTIHHQVILHPPERRGYPASDVPLASGLGAATDSDHRAKSSPPRQERLADNTQQRNSSRRRHVLTRS